MGEDSSASIHHQSAWQIKSLVVPDNLSPSQSLWMSPSACVTLSVCMFVSFSIILSVYYQINTTIQNAQLAVHVKLNSLPCSLPLHHPIPTEFNLLWGRATVNKGAPPQMALQSSGSSPSIKNAPNRIQHSRLISNH